MRIQADLILIHAPSVFDFPNRSDVLFPYVAKWDLDVAELLAGFDARVFGIDLHWVIHAHGSLALAKLLKSIHPDVPTLFGGISSTYYADELVGYPQVDMVMQGYDTHRPLHMLLQQLRSGGDLSEVPNLLYKDDRKGGVRTNPFDYKPRNLNCDAPAARGGWWNASRGSGSFRC